MSQPSSQLHTLTTISASSPLLSLKRRASPSFDCPEESSRKRLKEGMADNTTTTMQIDPATPTTNFVDDLAQELQCGCCSELVYKPVLVLPCQHFFCGSCCALWIKNGGTNCPACRGVSTVAMPFRALQSVIDSLLRAAPNKARTEREREQADEVYTAGDSLKLPPPREASPPPDVNRSAEYVHPCPHCIAGNPYGWTCPQPVVDPNTDVDHAWHVDDGLPPNHAHCGNCENLLALRAPQTTKCDFCLVMFCGINVPDRCLALQIEEQSPHGMTSHADMILSTAVYECFDGNTVEVEILLEYLDTQSLTPRQMYREIAQHIQKLPQGFTPLVELDLFSDVHHVAPVGEFDASLPRNNICRMCAAEVLLWGLKEWWLRERAKGFLEESIKNRKDCPDGSACPLQKDDHAHAREFNHIIGPVNPPLVPETAAAIDVEMAPPLPVPTQQNLPSNDSVPPITESSTPTEALLTVESSITIEGPVTAEAPIETEAVNEIEAPNIIEAPINLENPNTTETPMPTETPSSGSLSFLLNAEPSMSESLPTLEMTPSTASVREVLESFA